MKKKNYMFVTLKPFNNSIFYRNRIFDSRVGVSGEIFFRLRKTLEKNNIRINTIDVKEKNEPEKIVFLDVPYLWEMTHLLRELRHKKKNILFLWEEPVINPFNYMELFHRFFQRIYTWSDDLVDNKRFFKFYLPKRSDGINTKEVPFRQKALLIFVGSNLAVFPPFRPLTRTRELYTERRKAVAFFEEYARNDFAFYGRGWNKPQRFSIAERIFGFKRFSSYKGEIPTYQGKLATLARFKFCLCFENSEVNGGVTEKIIDCFKAKCVPIYRGAPNIDKYIPRSCYLDVRDFTDYDQILTFLRSVRKDEYEKYVENGKLLLSNPAFQRTWFGEDFIKTFINALQAD